MVLISPPPLVEGLWDEHCKQLGRITNNRANATTRTYADTCAELATEEKVAFVHLFKSMSGVQDWHKFLEDGLHLSAEGNQFLFHQLKDLIIANFATLNADKMDFDFPHWTAFY